MVSGVRGNGPIRPFAHNQNRIVFLDEHEWPFLCRRLMLERDHRTNGRERLHDVRIESWPHLVGSP